jgi:hypothetical protein
MATSEILGFKIHCLTMNLSEIAGEFLPMEAATKFDKSYSLLKLHIRALESGWEDFDWKKAHDLGWFSKRDYEVFAEELKGLSAEQWMEDRRKLREQGKS